MNFEFSDDLLQLRETARRYLAARGTIREARRVLEGAQTHDAALWQGLAKMGWIGAAIPEEHGGAGLGHEGLCILAEELGRAGAAVPFSSSAYLAAEALMLCGSPAQQQSWLPRLARGEVIGTLAWAEGAGNPRAAGIGTAIDGVVEAAGSAGAGMRLSGRKLPVPDGMIADFAIVVARDGGGAIRLVLVELAARGVARTRLATIDPTRDHAAVDFAAARGECLAVGGWSTVETVLERAAILTAFEQIGGASACLDMATAYARERHAFGRPIGSFQAIKHKLADVYIALELARSNAYFGAWALQAGAADLPLAAASARVAACEAFHLAAKESIQTHGGMGFTWEADCHLYYRRAACLALGLGSAGWWKDRLVTCLETRNAA